jgi:hypothetical protein
MDALTWAAPDEDVMDEQVGVFAVCFALYSIMRFL